MKEILNRALLAVVIVIAFATLFGFIKNANAADYSGHTELYMVNQSGGIIAVTLEPCLIKEAVALGYTNRAYATEGNNKKHEGCWVSPSIDEVNPADYPGVEILPVVNMYFEGDRVTFLQKQFGPLDPADKGVL